MKMNKKAPTLPIAPSSLSAKTREASPLSLPRLAVTVEEAAQMLGIGRSTAYALKASGELPCFTVGGRTRVAVKDLEEWVGRLAAQAVGANPANGTKGGN